MFTWRASWGVTVQNRKSYCRLFSFFGSAATGRERPRSRRRMRRGGRRPELVRRCSALSSSVDSKDGNEERVNPEVIVDAEWSAERVSTSMPFLRTSASITASPSLLESLITLARQSRTAAKEKRRVLSYVALIEGIMRLLECSDGKTTIEAYASGRAPYCFGGGVQRRQLDPGGARPRLSRIWQFCVCGSLGVSNPTGNRIRKASERWSLRNPRRLYRDEHRTYPGLW